MKGQRESLISSQARLCDRKVPFWRGNKQRAVLEEREVENKDNVFKSTLTPAVCLFHRLCLFYRKTLRLLKGIRCVPLGPLFRGQKQFGSSCKQHQSIPKVYSRKHALQLVKKASSALVFIQVQTRICPSTWDCRTAGTLALVSELFPSIS